jgi:hypothetical protein
MRFLAERERDRHGNRTRISAKLVMIFRKKR